MLAVLKRYTRWLHTAWPAGTVEKLPEVREDGTTNVAGLFVTGDLTGIPLLKFAADGGARVVQRIAADPAVKADVASPDGRHVHDLVIVGGGVSGMAAAVEAKKQGLDFVALEATEPFSTIVNFPRRKPIFTYPTDMTPAGDLQPSAKIKEELVAELRAQSIDLGIEPRAARAERVARKGKLFDVLLREGEGLLAKRVIVAIGRSGNFRKLGIPGQDREKVFNRLHDPKDFCGLDVLVVGGGDSAMETAIALAQCGCKVTLSYRKPEFSRPKPENVERLNALIDDPMADVSIEEPSSERVTTSAGPFLGEHRKPGSVRLMMASNPRSVGEKDVTVVDADGEEQTFANDAVFAMIGREPPLDFFRRSGVRIRGEWAVSTWVGFVAFFAFCFFLYNWKSGGSLTGWFQERGWFPFQVPEMLAGLSAAAEHPAHLLGTLSISMGEPSFYYSLAYCLAVVIFGLGRIRRRRTPYVTVQTYTLMAIQVIPLFLLPQIVLPWAGHNGWFESGFGRSLADALFPITEWGDHGREYWRSVGFILAWPLFIWNVFTSEPMWWWLGISLVQTGVIIPLMIRRFGKGSYCSWVCSCGALAETMGDAHRHKMPHGPFWNRLNMVGQVILALATVLFLLRVVSWTFPGTSFGRSIGDLYNDALTGWSLFGLPLNYYKIVDVFLAGMVPVAMYFWFSGRTWCRFACPLAALMHVYTRFTRFRILAEKKKCISCNVCTSVCHQGIDIMNFANKGLPMEDPECVRCSACVQSCPTGTLEFGRIDTRTGEELARDSLVASRVHLAERA